MLFPTVMNFSYRQDNSLTDVWKYVEKSAEVTGFDYLFGKIHLVLNNCGISEDFYFILFF